MENDAFYQYLKLIMDYFPIWFIALAAFVVWLVRNPHYLTTLSKHVSSAKIGDLEVQFREVKEEIKAARQQVEELQNDVLNQNAARLEQILEGFDTHASIRDLADTREAIKAIAPDLDDLSFVEEALRNYKNPKELYAAAEIARARRSPALFDDIVVCLDEVARAPDLKGIRLYTVWTLTKALHMTLVADIKHSPRPVLTRKQLLAADEMLNRLIANDRVQLDRTDDPTKGVQGPAKWSKDWIAKGLARLNSQQAGPV
ncbi:hypothetical protein FMN63_17180 [Stappia sp. BW2]|uniref:hypothetical protein n=1 Tax=Stappia sp. BW2 TaxID=2592622 RepID=UPI0011DEE32B|nr:hypothetical protein [Stappia sp. BW2]TYC67778.1 hypothetical protein FMN63_17180 [Stappia sp. BW2]